TGVRAVVLTGAGEKAFAAGADIKYMSGLGPDEAKAWGALGHEATLLLETMPKPTIAAVNGFALGGGCELALACDLRYASSLAKLGQPEIDLGIVPGWGGTQRLARVCGVGVAKDLVFSGRTIDAKEALRVGLVHAVADPVLDHALENACTVESCSVNAVSLAVTTVPASASVNGVPSFAKKRRCCALCRYGNGETAAPPAGCTSKCRCGWTPFASPESPT